MSKLNFYKDETKSKTERIYMEVAEELGVSYPKVVACIKDGLFRYIKEVVFLEFSNIQLRGFGTFCVSPKRIKKLSEVKRQKYESKNGVEEDTSNPGI